MVVLIIPKLTSDKWIYIITFGTVIGSLLFPIWLFQGLEKMKYITYFNLIARAFSTFLTFIVVKSENDVLNQVILTSSTSIMIGIISFFWVIKVFKIKFILPPFHEIKHQLKEGWHVFISTMSIIIYNSSPTLILGFFTNNTIVGYYAGALKIKSAFDGLFGPVYQTLYPYVTSLVLKSKEKAMKFIHIEAFIIGSLGLLSAIFIYLSADWLVPLLIGDKFNESIVLLKILAPSSFFVVFGFILTTQTLLSFNLKKTYSWIYMITSLAGLGGALLLTNYFKASGTALNLVFVELLVLLLTLFQLTKKGGLFNNKIKGNKTL